MKKFAPFLLLVSSFAVSAQTTTTEVKKPSALYGMADMTHCVSDKTKCVFPIRPPRIVGAGVWLDTTADSANTFYFGGSGDLLLTEDFVVSETHEVCGVVNGTFLSKSQLGRYDVRFKGYRSGSQWEFTTQYDAEQFVQKFCTPESLTSITKIN